MTTTQLSTLNIRKLTKSQYDNLETINDTDLYFVTDYVGFSIIDCGTSTTVV